MARTTAAGIDIECLFARNRNSTPLHCGAPALGPCAPYVVAYLTSTKPTTRYVNTDRLVFFNDMRVLNRRILAVAPIATVMMSENGQPDTPRRGTL